MSSPTTSQTAATAPSILSRLTNCSRLTTPLRSTCRCRDETFSINAVVRCGEPQSVAAGVSNCNAAMRSLSMPAWRCTRSAISIGSSRCLSHGCANRVNAQPSAATPPASTVNRTERSSVFRNVQSIAKIPANTRSKAIAMPLAAVAQRTRRD